MPPEHGPQLWRHTRHHPSCKQTRAELLDARRQRYQQASKSEQSNVVADFVAGAGGHRPHARRLRSGTPPAAATTPAGARRTSDAAVRDALIVLWEAADRIGGQRRKAVRPSLITALERPGHLARASPVRQRLLAARAATSDRLVASVRGIASSRTKRQQASKPRTPVPVRTVADWNEPEPGYLEIDVVAPAGRSLPGNFLGSLGATAISSGWTAAVPRVACAQSFVVAGRGLSRRQFPMPVLGMDSDNDSAFSNDALLADCHEQRLVFRRARA